MISPIWDSPVPERGQKPQKGNHPLQHSHSPRHPKVDEKSLALGAGPVLKEMRMMFRKMALTVMGLALLAVAGADGLSAQDTFEWSQRMSDGQVLKVRGISGEIRAVLASGSEAQLFARKKGDRDDFEEVAVEVEEIRDGYVICAVYGSWNHGEGHCHPDHNDRDDHDRDRRRNRSIDVEVEYEVRIPAGVEFDGGMINGEIEARDLRSEVEVHTVNGDIFVSTSEAAWANTVSGDIELEMGSFDWEEMEFNTVSGDITLWLPDNFSSDVRFSSLSGDLDTEFDLTMRNRNNRRWIGSDIRGTIGDGGRDLYIHTISGNADLGEFGNLRTAEDAKKAPGITPRGLLAAPPTLSPAGDSGQIDL
jgi:hypothetical protein